MTRALITVELLPNDMSGEMLLHCLDRTIAERMAGMSYTVARKSDFVAGRDLMQGCELAISGVRAASPPPLPTNPDEDRWGIYLCPRRMEFVLNKEVRMALSTVLIAIANQGTPVGIFLQTITSTEVPEEIALTLYDHMETARSQLITECLPPQHVPVLEGFTSAIGEAYGLAFGDTRVH